MYLPVGHCYMAHGLYHCYCESLELFDIHQQVTSCSFHLVFRLLCSTAARLLDAPVLSETCLLSTSCGAICRKSLSLKQDVEQQLDQHYRVLFKANTFELQLFYECEGCSIRLSLVHGAMLSEGSAARADVPAAAVKASVKPLNTAAEGDDTQAMLAKARMLLATNFGIDITAEPIKRLVTDTTAANSSVAQATQPAASAKQADTDEQDDDAQALLARARALMAVTQADM